MASTYTTRLRLEKQGDGENDTTWGQKANTVFDLADDAIAGMTTINTTGGSTTLTSNNGAADEARRAILKVTGTLVSNATLTIPAQTKTYIVWNATSGSFTVTIKTSGGTGVAITQGKKFLIFCDGTDCFGAIDDSALLPSSATGEVAGSLKPWPGLSAPSGWDFCYGQAVSRTTYATLFATLMQQATVTISQASPSVITWTAHGLRNGQPIEFTSTGSLPIGFSTGTTYYIVSATTNNFSLAASPGGTAINTSSAGSGIHTAICSPWGKGDGSTTFNLPDLRGRQTIGRDDMGGSAANRLTTATISTFGGLVVGKTGGAETVTLTEAQMPEHTHGAGTFSVPFGGTGGSSPKPGAADGDTTAVTGTSGSTGSSSAHTNLPPVAVTDWIIKLT